MEAIPFISIEVSPVVNPEIQRPLQATDLASGRLLRPFELSINTGKAYYLI
jgi:hypothetical protein